MPVVGPVVSEDVAHQILAGVGLGDRVLNGDLVVADGGEDAFGDRRVLGSPAVDREVLELVVWVLFVRDLGVEVLATDLQKVLIELLPLLYCASPAWTMSAIAWLSATPFSSTLDAPVGPTILKPRVTRSSRVSDSTILSGSRFRPPVVGTCESPLMVAVILSFDTI